MTATIELSKVSRRLMDTIEAATNPRQCLDAARRALAELQQREAALRAVMTENETKAASMRREHELAEQAAQQAAQALGRAEAAAALGEADAEGVRLAREELSARRKAADKLRPRLDEATAADAAAAAVYERLRAVADETSDVLTAIRAASSLLVREVADEALAAYDRAAAEASRAMLRVHAVAAFAADARRFDLFSVAKHEVRLPPLEAGRKPVLTEAEVAAIAAEEASKLRQEMQSLGVDLAPGAADPWTTGR